MKTIFVMYMPGHAGNLINRLISLSPETVPQLSVNNMRSIVENNIPLDIEKMDRLSAYSFLHANNYSSWQHFHRDCIDFYYRNLVTAFSKLHNNEFTHVVYAIHPEEFEIFECEIDTMWDLEKYYVSLAETYGPWVEKFQETLKFQTRPGEYKKYQQFVEQYNMKPINLTKMLDSQAGFEEEYLQIISKLGLTPKLEQARNLFNEWLELRGPVQ